MKNKIILGLFLLMSMNFSGNCVAQTGVSQEFSVLRTLAEDGKIGELLNRLDSYRIQFSSEYPNLLTRLSTYLSNNPNTWNNLLVTINGNSALLTRFINLTNLNTGIWNKLVAAITDNSRLQLGSFMAVLSTGPEIWNKLLVAIKNNQGLLNNFVNAMGADSQIWNKLLVVLKDNSGMVPVFFDILNQKPDMIIALLNRVKDMAINNPALKQHLIALVLQDPVKWTEYLSRVKSAYPTEWEQVKNVLAGVL